jgi:LysR family transcriptional regulator, low CO2-responsive transcriptional regulator
MCAAGFGPAYLSMHTCVLEMNAGLLQLLPLEHNPIEREWFVVRLQSRALPQVALSFDQFLRARGQTEMQNLLAERWASAANARPALAAAA